MALAAVAVHGDVHFIQQGVCSSCLGPVGGGRCVPDLMQVVAEGQDGGTFGAGEGLGPEGLATGKLGLGFGHCPQRGLPAGFQASPKIGEREVAAALLAHARRADALRPGRTLIGDKGLAGLGLRGPGHHRPRRPADRPRPSTGLSCRTGRMTPSRQLGDRQQHSRGLQRLEAVARVRHDKQVTGPTIPGLLTSLATRVRPQDVHSSMYAEPSATRAPPRIAPTAR